MDHVNATGTDDWMDILPAQPGIRYHIYGCYCTVKNVDAGDTASSAAIFITQEGELGILSTVYLQGGIAEIQSDRITGIHLITDAGSPVQAYLNLPADHGSFGVMYGVERVQ